MYYVKEYCDILDYQSEWIVIVRKGNDIINIRLCYNFKEFIEIFINPYANEPYIKANEEYFEEFRKMEGIESAELT